MSEYRTINANATERFFTMIKKADGDPIISGTVNYYLKAQSGANVGKWWRDSDQTWQVAETANAMTHSADGHWEIDLNATSPFTNGVKFFEYAKESGDLHIPDSRHLIAGDPLLGPGGTSATVTVQRSGVAEAGVDVWISTDIAGTNVVAGVVVSDVAGEAEFSLDDATYYSWAQKAGMEYGATNPQTVVVPSPATSTHNGVAASAPSLVGAGAPRIPRPEMSRRRKLLTLAGAVDRLLRMEEINAAETRAVERAIEAVLSARESFVSHSTSGFHYYDSRYNINLTGNYELGSITVSDNTVTPTNSTFPAWIDLAYLRVNNKSYPVTGYTATTFDLGGSLADGTYTGGVLEQLIAPLPQDFRRRGSISDGANVNYSVFDMTAGLLQSWQDYQEWGRSAVSTQAFAAVTGDERFQGDLMLMIWPPYTNTTMLQMFYERYPAPLDFHRVGTGELACSGTTVTADNAVFAADHVGSILTISVGNDTEISNPLSSRDLVETQRVITSFTNTTTVEVDQSLTVSARTFYISDPVDVQPGPQKEAFLRLAEFEMARQSKSRTAEVREAQFRRQLELAMADDSRYRESVDEPLANYGYGIGEVTGRPD